MKSIIVNQVTAYRQLLGSMPLSTKCIFLSSKYCLNVLNCCCKRTSEFIPKRVSTPIKNANKITSLQHKYLCRKIPYSRMTLLFEFSARSISPFLNSISFNWVNWKNWRGFATSWCWLFLFFYLFIWLGVKSKPYKMITGNFTGWAKRCGLGSMKYSNKQTNVIFKSPVYAG